MVEAVVYLYYYMDDSSIIILYVDEHITDIETTSEGYKIFMTLFMKINSVVKNRENVSLGWE